MDARCLSCKYFNPTSFDDDAAKTATWGECRRLPPVPVFNPHVWTESNWDRDAGKFTPKAIEVEGCVQAEWPEVDPHNDWCGEFDARNPNA